MVSWETCRFGSSGVMWRSLPTICSDDRWCAINARTRLSSTEPAFNFTVPRRHTLCACGIIVRAHRVSGHFVRDRAGWSREFLSNSPKAPLLISASVDQISLAHRQLAVVISHAYTLANWVLHFILEFRRIPGSGPWCSRWSALAKGCVGQQSKRRS